MDFRNFDSDAFLRDHWQKKSLPIRNPWDAWRNPLDPNELAGLACEEGVESRLIQQTPDRIRAEDGPFPEARLGQLCEAPWTLLVQAVDHYVPAVAALIAPFRFIPDWRIDDVMVSCAGDGGGVGPHFDQYDVFLIQGLGTRRWQVGGMCDENTELLPYDDLRLLADFQVREEWLLEPGDMLYVPPGVAHNGVAVGEDCMTYSIGFRAPSRKELVGYFVDDMLAGMEDGDRYTDPDLRAQANPGEITAAALDRLHAMVTEAVADREAFARWFGTYSTTPKYPEMEWQPEDPPNADEIRKRLSESATLHRNPASRFSFVRQGEGKLLLFVDGECFECEGEAAVLAEGICARDAIKVHRELPTSKSVMALMAKLIDFGSMGIESGVRD